MLRDKESISLSIAKAIRAKLVQTPAMIEIPDPKKEDESISLDVIPDPLWQAKHDGHGANFVVEIDGPEGIHLRRRVIVTEL